MRKILKMIQRFLCIAGILLCCFCPTTVKAEVSAGMDGLPSISAASMGNIINENSTIDGRYDFTPLIGKNTKITFGSTNGKKWDNIYCKNAEKYAKCCSSWWPLADTKNWSNTHSFTPYASDKGKMYVEYSNVGESGGDHVTLRIWMEDWQNTIVPKGYDDIDAVIVSVDHDKPVINIKGLRWIKVRFAYYDSNGNPLKVKGHFTLSDLDYAQGFFLQDPVKNIYLTKEADARLVYDARTKAIWSAKPGGITPDDPAGWLTYTFEGNSQTIVFYNGDTIKLVTKPGGGLSKTLVWPDDYMGSSTSPYKNWHGSSRETSTEQAPWFTSEFGYTSEIPCHLSKIGDLVVKKTDSETKEALLGAEFTVYQWKNNAWKEVQKMAWEDRLQAYFLGEISGSDSTDGKFKVVETKNPSGYTGKWEKEFSITQEGTQTIHLAAENKRKKGKITIIKSGSAGEGKLAGAVYQIIASGNITTAGGTVLVKDGTVVDQITTNAKGQAVTKELELGTYLLKEIQAPPGYLVPDRAVKVSIKDVQPEVLLNFQNDKNHWVLKKTDEETGNPLQGASFRIWRKEGGFDEVRKTDENGEITLSGIEDGTWYYQETDAPDGYLLEDVRGEWKVQNGKVDGKSSLRVSVKNAATHLEIAKVDAFTGHSLAGAALVLKDQDGNRIDSWISEEQPKRFDHLKPGNYRLEEEKAPDHYLKADAVSFVLEAKKEVQTVIMQDLRCTELTIAKKIRAEEITWAHGNPIFLFTIKGTDLYGRDHNYERCIEFTENYVKTHTGEDGYTECSVTIQDIPAGESYDVREKKVLRYGLVQVTGTENVTVKKLQEPKDGIEPEKIFQVNVNLAVKEEGSRVVFENRKYRWDDYGHNCVVKNVIPLQK